MTQNEFIEEYSKEENKNIFSLLNNIFSKLVPPSGPAETLVGELVRAMTMLGYAYFEYGSTFEDNIKLNSCLLYLLDFIEEHGEEDDYPHALEEIDSFSASEDDSYEELLSNLFNEVCNILVRDKNASLFEEINDKDCLSMNDEDESERDYESEYLDKCQKIKDDYLKFSLDKKELKEDFTEDDLDDDAVRRCCFKYNCGKRQLIDMLREVI